MSSRAMSPMFFKKNPWAMDDSELTAPIDMAPVPGSTGSVSSALSPAPAGPSLQGTDEFQQYTDVGNKLRQALQPNQVSMPRALIGALFARRNPMLSSVITGDYQRQKQIQPLEQQFGLLGNIIAQNRAMQKGDLDLQNTRSEITERGRSNDIRQQVAETKEAPPAKTPTERDIEYLQG